MIELTLAQRLLTRIGQISQRSDVIVQQQTGPRNSIRLDRWQSKLPADMFAFYKEINGFQLHYSFAGAPDHGHGLELLALDKDGRGTIDTRRKRWRLPYQAAKRYPEYFFQTGEVDANTPVLFFFGSDDAWGVLMLGEGEGASFHHWDNDGFVKPLGSSFTEVIERLMDRGFPRRSHRVQQDPGKRFYATCPQHGHPVHEVAPHRPRAPSLRTAQPAAAPDGAPSLTLVGRGPRVSVWS